VGSNAQSTTSWPASLSADPGIGSALESETSRILALMRQDMSAFGAKAGEADLNWRKAEAQRPMDFFA
jgi:hypothetical protein